MQAIVLSLNKKFLRHTSSKLEDILLKAVANAQLGKPFAFATVIDATIKGTPRKAGAKMIVYQDGTSWGSIGGGRNEKAAIAECLKCIKNQKPTTVTYNYFGRVGESVCGGQINVFIEPFIIPKKLIICGAGHIALPLSWMAKVIGFHVTILDSRKEYANIKRFPHVDRVICGDYVKKLPQIAIDSNTYIAIVTHGNENDFECLKEVVDSDAAYIGVISSQPKRVKFIKRLKDLKISDRQIKRISIPMGIDIGSETPEEIAVSICAQLTAIKNKEKIGTSKFL